MFGILLVSSAVLTISQRPCPIICSHGLSDFQRYDQFTKSEGESQEGGHLYKAAGILLNVQLTFLKVERFEI